MEEGDRSRFVALMAALKIAFREPPMEKRVEMAQARLYFEYLSSYPIGKVAQAVERAIRELKWFPKIAELIELMKPDPSYWPEFPRLELKEREISREEARECLDLVYEHVERQEQKETEDREQRFKDRKKILEAQKKIVLGEA